MKIYGKCSLARAWMVGLIVLAPASLAWAQGFGPVRGDQTDAPQSPGPRVRSGNRLPQTQRVSPDAAPRGQQRELQGNQAFRPNFDRSGPSARQRPIAPDGRSGPATNGGNRKTVADVDRRQPQPPPIMVYEFTNLETCAPCKQAAPIVKELIHDGYPILVVDLAKKPELAEKFHIEGLPTFVRVENGRETGRALGAQSADDLAAFCEGEDLNDDDNGDDADDDADEEGADDDEDRATEMPGPTFVDRPVQSGRGQFTPDDRRPQGITRPPRDGQPMMGDNRGQFLRGRPTSGAQGQFPDRRLANNQWLPLAMDGRPVQGNPAQFRRNPNPQAASPQPGHPHVANPQPGNQGQAMNGRPSSLRRLPPIGAVRTMQGNPAQFMHRGSGDLPDSG